MTLKEFYKKSSDLQKAALIISVITFSGAIADIICTLIS
jgi:hypothetical protein